MAPVRARQQREGDGSQTTTLDLQSRACGCPRCNACAPPFPSGDAPTDIQIQALFVVFDGYWQTSASRHGITYPLEFLAVESAKIITIRCRHEDFRWPFSHGFDHYTRHYRFRTNNPHVDVAFFWGDGRIRYSTRFEFVLKLRLTPREGVSRGEHVRLILQCRPNGSGAWRDLTCLRSAVVFQPLAQLRGIARYFGQAQWSVGDVGFFLDRSRALLTVRMSGERRAQLRRWVDQPLVPYQGLGIVTREFAIVTVLALLWYLDDEHGAQIAEFFGDPIGFIQRAFSAHADGAANRYMSEQRAPVVRSTYGRVMRQFDRPTRQRLIWLRRRGSAAMARAQKIVEIAEWLTGAARVAIETIRIARFVESVLRTDTLCTTAEQPFFVTFGIDPVTATPNGVVAVNLVPDGSFRWSWHVGGSVLSNQLLFWESADAYYLSLLNVDRRVRQAVSAGAQRETEGKSQCHVCDASADLDRRCTVCSQSYHWRCMRWEFGSADCPRCLQRDVVDPIEAD